MIINRNIEITINTRTQPKYPHLNVGDKLTIDIDELQKYSRTKIKAICDICGEEKDIKYCNYIQNISSNNLFACSRECCKVKRNMTNLEKYGCINVFQNNEIKRKIENGFIEKYGVSNMNKLESQIIKIKKTKLEKYGDEKYYNLDKMIETNLKKYGTKFVGQNKEVKEKIKKTNIERYGFEQASKNEDVKNKSKRTILERYGVENYMYSDAWTTKTKNSVLLKYNLNLIENNFPYYKFKCDKCNKEFEINITVLYQRYEYNTTICTICNPIGSHSQSGLEMKLYDFIKENYNDTILTNNRKIISNELDIYLPEEKLAFEFNGLWWHNDLYRNIDYHTNKTNECEEKGIELIQIYEDDWRFKQDIIKSLIIEKLNKTQNIINSNNCNTVQIYDKKLISDFLNINHISGYIKSDITFSLYYNGEIVSLMTFKENANNNYELLRFCNKNFFNIIDSEKKLLNHFKSEYLHNSIITYVDRSYNNGEIFKNLGFTLSKKTKSNKYYIINEVRYLKYFKNNYKSVIQTIHDSGYLKFII